MSADRGVPELERENAELRLRLEIAESVVAAIDRSEVDAFIVRRDKGEEREVLVLGGVDRPYRLLIERMQQGAAIVSSDGTIVYSNQRLDEMLAHEASQPFAWKLQELVAARDRKAATAALERGGRQTTELEVTLERRGDEGLPVQLTLSPLLDQADLVCVVVTDLTHRRELERQREVLVKEQGARASAEERAALLRETDRRKDAFLATLAHELRNPLAPLRNGLFTLQLGRLPEADVQRTHQMLARQVETLVRLVDDLLDLGRLTQGKVRLQREACDLRQAVARALETCQPGIETHGHQVTTALPPEPVTVDGDALRLIQVLTNLLNNAVKYTPAGGTIEVRLEADASAAQAVVQVRDTGLGIPSEMLERIFEPFAQVEPSEETASSGLGIGLTLARSLVEMHGGGIEARSDGPGRGSEFTVRLPLAGAPRAARPATARAAGAEPVSSRILIVDDNRDAAESLGILLRCFGHEVRLEHSAREVAGVTLEFRPDVVLLDVGLPEMNGYEVARGLRSDARCRDVYIVGLSGYAASEDRARAFAAGFDEHRAKPVELADLQQLLARVMRKRSERRRAPQPMPQARERRTES